MDIRTNPDYYDELIEEGIEEDNQNFKLDEPKENEVNENQQAEVEDEKSSKINKKYRNTSVN